MSANHLRVTVAAPSTPIPVEEATAQARAQFQDARDAYIDLLEVFGEPRLRWLLRSREKVTVRALRSARDSAQRMAERALAVVSALDSCVETCERAARTEVDR